MPGGYDDHIGNSKAVIFMLDDNPDGAAKSMTLAYATVSSIRVGDHKPGAGQFVPVGTAVAETRNPERDYGGADGAVGGGVILAEYVPPVAASPTATVVVGPAGGNVGMVYPLDNLGQRTSRLKPWIVGQNITLLADPTKPSKGFVLRGNQMGDKGFDAHVYIAANAGFGNSAPIILHHRSPNPPLNSTQAYDPDMPENKAPLSDALRIVSGIDGFCKLGKTTSKPQAVIRWVVINATLSGGRFSGYFAAKYAAGTALHSAETSGNLTVSTSKHDLGYGDDGTAIRPGANHCDGLWTRGNPDFDAPLDIEDVEEPDVMEQEGHPMRVHCQHDKDVDHAFTCGPRKGKRRWHKKEPIAERPPCEGAKQPGHSVVFPATAIGYFVGQLEMNGMALLSNPRA